MSDKKTLSSKKTASKNLKKLGIAVHESKSRKLIIRCETPAKVKTNTPVYHGKRKIGRIYDAFGPVEKPYISVKLSEGIQAGELINKPIYGEKR